MRSASRSRERVLRIGSVDSRPTSRSGRGGSGTHFLRGRISVLQIAGCLSGDSTFNLSVYHH
ncbi:Uncharacterized protein DAT39_013045 [Clarias magur]|uniref:Uncharacterized protein n=1 Tax=Clarias magur TaxID=1594786 RepID=A0A8J4XD69_CLAMG|nr:Uncharacterized protein DAT39_013045 [Clarias magur]